MTQPEVETQEQDEPIMPDKNPKFESKLSPSATAILRFVKTFEEGGQLQVFQTDAEFELLQAMVTTYRGSLHSLLTRRLEEVVNLGGVSIISQRDIMSLIVNLWEENISRLSGSPSGEYMSPEEFERLITEAGRTPRRRTTLYEIS